MILSLEHTWPRNAPLMWMATISISITIAWLVMRIPLCRRLFKM